MRRNPPKRPIDRASDPDTPVEELLRLAEQFPIEVIENPIMGLLSLEDPAAYTRILTACQAEIANEFVNDFAAEMRKRNASPYAIADAIADGVGGCHSETWERMVSRAINDAAESRIRGHSLQVGISYGSRSALVVMALTRTGPGADSETLRAEMGRISLKALGRPADKYLKNGRRRHGW